MRIRWPGLSRALVWTAVLALLVAACAPAATPAPETPAPGAPTPTPAAAGEPVVVCELAYYTGPFAAYGPHLTANVVFPVEKVINTDPPLGRPWVLYHEDIGTVGEAQAARTCLELHGAEILVSIAHEYRTYRDWLMEWWQEHDSPIGPSNHGGAIPGNLGGNAAEPIFRAQGLDESLGISGVLYAEKINAQRIVIFATQVEGFQLAADAAQKAAEFVGIEVLARIDVPAELPSYRAEAERIADLAPDAVIVQAGSVESATLIKQAAEAGISLYWIGESGWILPEFIGTLGTEPIGTQKGIGIAAFTHRYDTPAWEFFQPLWDNAPGFGDTFGPASDIYNYTGYDLMVHTALAIEAAGSLKASAWAPAMHEVGEAPGTVCHTYAECLALIRAGEDIDYEGVTGPAEYTEGGANAVTAAYKPFNLDGTSGVPILLDAHRGLEILDAIGVRAECEPENPPNVCVW
ncbi:MAG TPA: ABC transporter substrate-binding protein [Desulfobacterales bacterium]|nr:ABC transporter substrate-binding protein [Desulfobacterales bacterium]